jgi:hypothetical protein
VKSPFFFHTHLQVPQSDFCPIPATCLGENSLQVALDYTLGGLGGLCDLCIRASFKNKCRDSPFFTCKVRVPKQQRHTAPHFKQNLATGTTASQSRKSRSKQSWMGRFEQALSVISE